MTFPVFHSAVDQLAMWSEDRLEHAPQPWRDGPTAPLGCFGPLPPLPAPPGGAGPWSCPSPRARSAEDRLSIRVAPPRGPRRGTLLLVPPWKIGRPGLVAGWTRLLAGLGWEVWLVSPPHHLERAGSARSGEGFVTLDLAALRATFEQLVLELRLLAALAAPRGPVGVVGLSLGALGAALAATGPEVLDLAALVAPPSLEAVLAETPIGRRYQRLATAAGRPLPPAAELLHALAPFDPGRRRPTARKLFLAAGRYDAVSPPRGPRALAEAWGVPLHAYPRGHMTLLFLCRALRRDLARAAAPEPLAARQDGRPPAGRAG